MTRAKATSLHSNHNKWTNLFNHRNPKVGSVVKATSNFQILVLSSAANQWIILRTRSFKFKNRSADLELSTQKNLTNKIPSRVSTQQSRQLLLALSSIKIPFYLKCRQFWCVKKLKKKNQRVNKAILKVQNMSKLRLRRRKKKLNSSLHSFTTECIPKVLCFSNRWQWTLSTKLKLKTGSKKLRQNSARS